ncbi:MAG: nicotinamide riboside transporter PnuC [Eubacterium sp.]|nr:nicotinamide riboside transporter PnuC [Eubacterium sp.]MDE6766698.1 nicotinamide riboside transporter PnuC [Eubacterium sp.]
MKFLKSFKRLTKFEFVLWFLSVSAIAISFLFGTHKDIITIIASLIGVTALIFVAKGDVFGQILTVVFSVFYAIISFRFSYYGEMITYLGMTAPIAVMSVITWLKNPYEKGENEVKIANLTKKKIIILILLTIFVTFIFYFILKYFNNANLFMSTVSIATSFSASVLMLLRSPYYAVAYACNDVVLIVLWVMAAMQDIAFLSMIICFVIFFVNDLYGFFNWRRMMKRQKDKL